jgi:hypothetical protein
MQSEGANLYPYVRQRPVILCISCNANIVMILSSKEKYLHLSYSNGTKHIYPWQHVLNPHQYVEVARTRNNSRKRLQHDSFQAPLPPPLLFDNQPELFSPTLMLARCQIGHMITEGIPHYGGSSNIHRQSCRCYRSPQRIRNTDTETSARAYSE